MTDSIFTANIWMAKNGSFSQGYTQQAQVKARSYSIAKDILARQYNVDPKFVKITGTVNAPTITEAVNTQSTTAMQSGASNEAEGFRNLGSAIAEIAIFASRILAKIYAAILEKMGVPQPASKTLSWVLTFVSIVTSFALWNSSGGEPKKIVAPVPYAGPIYSPSKPPQEIVVAGRTSTQSQPVPSPSQRPLVTNQTASSIACDSLAGNPTDSRRNSQLPGNPYGALRAHVDEAIRSCEIAIREFPSEFRFQYQLGRSLQLRDRNKAFKIHERLVASEYPASFDNLGWIYLEDLKNSDKAVRLFIRGAELNDPDSMISMVEMLGRGLAVSSNVRETKIDYLKRAIALGHPNAARALQTELSKAQ